MAITFVNSSQADAVAASVAVSAPAGIADGDILVAWVMGNQESPAAITYPGGWALWATQYDGAVCGSGMLWKRCSSESGTYTFGQTSAPRVGAQIMAFRGCVASGDPADVAISSTQYVTSNTTVRAAGITTVTASDCLVWGGYCQSLQITGPTGFTHQLTNNINANSYYFQQFDYLLNQAAGATGNIDGSVASAATVKGSMMVALKPAAATGIVTANLSLELVAKRAAGTTQGINSPLTSVWNDNVGTNDYTLFTGTNGFAGTTSSGWAGAGTVGDPYCLVCDGNVDYATPASTPSAIASDADFTLELWSYMASQPTNPTYYFSHTWTADSGVWFYFDDKPYFRIGSGSAQITKGGTAGWGWHHHVMTYDAATNAFNVYTDGSVVGSATTTTYSPYSGQYYLSMTDTTRGEHKIATVRLYTSALSAADVSSNYNAGILAASTDGALGDRTSLIQFGIC